MCLGKVRIYLPSFRVYVHFACMYVCAPLVCLVSVKARVKRGLQMAVSCHQGLCQGHSVLFTAELSLQLLGKIPDLIVHSYRQQIIVSTPEVLYQPHVHFFHFIDLFLDTRLKVN